LRGRIIGDGLGDFFTDLRLEITNENICYFKNFHHALRENPRIDIIMKMPKCTVLRIKFFSDKKRLVMSLSNGTLLFYNTNENCIQKVFVNKMAIMDLMKIIDDKYLIIAGIDSKVRIWNIDSEKIISKF
jgi:WD40 repeat protein